MKSSNIFRGLRTLKEIKEKPIGFVIDLLLSVILSALIPIPFVGSVVARYRTAVLWWIGGLVITGLAIIFLLISVIFYPLTIFNPHGQGQLPSSLKDYIEAGFSDTDTPQKNPLGGDGYTNSIITMDYHDPNYHFFDGIHTGIDFVPSDTYYSTNKAYAITKQLILFVTMNGQAKSYQDQYGANVVDVYNSANSILTRYLHLEASFISTGDQVKAGMPLGIMGQTGEATGVHLHYEIRVNQGGTFVTVDPKDYIH